MQYVSVEEMEMCRLGSELFSWVEGKIEEIAQKKGGTRALRLHEGGCKELIEEVFPLAIWVSRLDTPEQVLVKPKIGSQNYDALVIDRRAGTEESFHVEVTQAHRGESEFLRRLHLQREGWAPGPLQDMSKVGSKLTGLIVKAGRLLTTIEGSVRKSEALVFEAVQKKVGKCYPKATRLVVAFEDFIVAKAERIEQRLALTVERAVAGKECPFSHVYLVGTSRRILVLWEPES